MKYKVAELEGALLDEAVAEALGGGQYCFGVDINNGREVPGSRRYEPYSSVWDCGGPIIERERIAVAFFCDTDIGGDECGWRAAYVDGGGYFASVHFQWLGPTPLVAAMRAFVASRFGDEVELPDGAAIRAEAG